MKLSDTQDAAYRPPSGGSRWTQRLVGSVALVAVSLLIFSSGAPSQSARDELAATSPSGEAKDAPKEQDPQAGSNNDRLITKRIPDQKAYVGSQRTVIELDELFGDTPVAAGGGSLEFEIKHNKEEKVAKVTVDGSRLQITWGKIGKSEIILRATNSQTNQYLDNKFNVEVWEADYTLLVMTVIGGLGIFLLGMKSMSEGLQAVAGNSLRRMISLATNNRLLATGVGTLVTMLVQSSSITTVMAVGFVNSGFMTLNQAIGVIMGANIGTTITGWILALSIGKYGLPLLGLGAFGYLFSKHDRLRYASMAVMGLGMIFFGLELMKDGFAMIKDLPDFEAWFARFTADSYLGVLKCAAVGCILTLIVQSSSATLGITIGLAVINVIPFDTAAALVLGENVGTTITAWLASFGATSNARRAAYFHVLFNLIGVLWVTAIFLPFYLPAVKWLAGIDPETGQVANVTGAIATTHTLFNVTNTLLFLPLSGLLATMLRKVVPDKAHKEKPHLTSLEIRVLETPVIAIEQSRVEILRMGEGCNKMMDWLKTLSAQEEPDQQLVERLFHREEVLDTIQDEVVAFMTNLLSAHLPHAVIDEGRRQLRMADEYESISDYIVSILKFRLKLRKQGQRFDAKQCADLGGLHDMVAVYLRMVTEGYAMRLPEVITKAHSQGSLIASQIKDLRNRHLGDISKHDMAPQTSLAFTATLNSYRRVRDHTLNIAESLAGEK